MAIMDKAGPVVRVNFVVVAAVMLMFVYMIAAAEGGCENYGHSCWGSHGKRSFGGSQTDRQITGDKQELIIPEWFISRLEEIAHRRPKESTTSKFNVASNQIGTDWTHFRSRLRSKFHPPQDLKDSSDVIQSPGQDQEVLSLY